jgi:hypothetical protein
MSEKKDDWDQISISLPVRYWVSMFSLTDQFIGANIKPKFEELRKRGTKPDEIPDPLRAALLGPVFARGAMVDALVDAGVMKPEVKEKMGDDILMEMARKYYEQNRKKNGSH